MSDRCSLYKLSASSKGNTQFDFFNVQPPYNEYSDYMYWNNKKTDWVVASSSIILGYNNETSGRQLETVAIGYAPGHASQGTGAISIGYYAGYSEQHQLAIAIGSQAAQQTQSQSAIAIGHQSGQQYQSQNTVAIGQQSGQQSQSQNSVAIGHQSGQQNQGLNAVAIGAQAGQQNQGLNAIAIGHQSGQQQGSNAIVIGSNTGATFQAANSIIINASNTQVNPLTSGLFVKPAIRGPLGLTNVLSYNISTNEIFYNSSSRRYKHDIQLSTHNSEMVYQLEPKKFKYNIDDSPDLGFIAEEADPLGLAYTDKEGIPEGIKWNTITVYLIAEFKKLNERRNVLKMELLKLKELFPACATSSAPTYDSLDHRGC